MRNRMGRIGFRWRSSCRERKGPLLQRLALVYRRRHRHRRGFFGYGDHGDSERRLSCRGFRGSGGGGVGPHLHRPGWFSESSRRRVALCPLGGRWPWRGLWLLAQPPIRRREQTASQFSSWYAAGVAVGLYGVGQTAWYVQPGKLRDLPVLALFLAAAVWCTVRQFWRLGGEPDETRRRQERIIALLYTVAQGVLLLLTAEAGFGLVALVLHIGVYFICAAAITWRRSGRGKH